MYTSHMTPLHSAFKSLLSKLPIVALLLLLAVGVGMTTAQVSSWQPPTATPPNNDVTGMIDVSQTWQAKGGGPAIPGSLLDIDDITNQNDVFATRSLAVWHNTRVVDGSSYVLSLNGPKYVCSDNTGKLTTCMPQITIPENYTDYCTENPADCEDWVPAPGGSHGWDSLYACFIAGTQVTMADGSLKAIEAVKIGDVLEGETSDNTVLAFHRPPKSDGILYGFNGGAPFVTAEHPFMTTKGWKSINPEKTKREHIGIEVTKLEKGDELVTEHGTEKIEMITSKEVPQDTPLYNFVLSGDRTYYADGFLVHNKTPCWGNDGTFYPPCMDTSVNPYILNAAGQGSSIRPTACNNVGHAEISSPIPVYIPGCGGSYKYKGCYESDIMAPSQGVLACGNYHP